MEKLYKYLSGIYRFIIIIVFIYLHVQSNKEHDISMIIMYVVFVFYALLFTVLKTSRWVSYLELIILASLIYFYKESSLYYLLLMPVIEFTSSNIKKYDILLFSILFSGFVYLQVGQHWFVLFSFIGLLSSLVIFNSKLNQIELLETKLFRERKTYQESRKMLMEKETELDNVLKMFMKSKELNELKEENRIIEALASSAKEFFNAHYACLYLEKENGVLQKHLEVGRDEKFETYDILTEDQVETDKIEDEMLQTVIYHQEKRWGAIRVYGKMAVIGEREQKVFMPFNELDHELLLIYVEQVLIKLKEVKLLQKNEYLANNDFLTGIPNRRYFIERFEQFSAIASRGGDFSIMILDIDHFKHFNDKYGHETGDAVLRIVSETLAEAIRDKYDVVGRLGGEEFGILLLNPNDMSFEVADRIRRLISVVPAVEQITVSIGLAYYGEDGTTWEELYNNADKALYYAKENGRNQVIEYRDI